VLPSKLRVTQNPLRNLKTVTFPETLTQLSSYSKRVAQTLPSILQELFFRWFDRTELAQQGRDPYLKISFRPPAKAGTALSNPTLKNPPVTRSNSRPRDIRDAGRRRRSSGATTCHVLL
jgi:hypothetical protein